MVQRAIRFDAKSTRLGFHPSEVDMQNRMSYNSNITYHGAIK